MRLGPGVHVGPYEIQSAIGAGGMGEVYRARDGRLNRDVALKVLPDSVARDPERLARFRREAQVLASLNHSHIAAIYGFEDSGETHALVLELVDGPTLADRLSQGPIPLGEALPIARQIAEALEAAHEQGIVHRDLKPPNIKLRPDGSVKVLDFGLARAVEAAPGSGATMSPTITSPALITGAGVLLGTAAYMAPEQARGKPVDKRADIWAFGCVLYEMLTGKRAFEGDEIADVLARVIEREPDFAALPPRTPPAIRRLLRRALEKDRRRRLDSAVAARLDIEEAMSSPAESTRTETRRGLRHRARLVWSAASTLLIIAALAAGALYYVRTAPNDAPPVRFFVSPPDGWELAGLSGSPLAGAPAPLAMSPDGRTLAFVARSMDGRSLIWLRSLGTVDARPLDGTEGADSPFWSPDSSALGFFAAGKLKRIAVSGGPAITLADAPNHRGGVWSREGVIVFAPTITSPLMRLPAAGGTPAAVTTLGEGETGHLRPLLLPDGRHFLYRVATSPGKPQPFHVGSLVSPEHAPLLTPDSGNVAYSQGYLLFLREATLMAQPFDPGRLTLTGDAFPVADRVQAQGAPGSALVGLFSASENGVLVYQTATGGGDTELTWFDRAGKQLGVLGQPGRYSGVEFSTDAKQVSVSLPDQGVGPRDIWTFDVVRNLRTRFTFDAADEFTSTWSPDGSRVAFNSRRKGHFDLYVKAASGAGTEELLFADRYEKYPVSWSPDGQRILFVSTGDSFTSSDLFVLPLSGDHKPVSFLNAPFSEAGGQFSPDGRWIAYTSNESGRYEVYVAPFAGQGGKWQISTSGGNFARWSRNGSEIVYVTPDKTLMAVQVNGKATGFDVGAVTPLFRTRMVTSRANYEYLVSPDGQRFLINTLAEQTTASPITVVLNWTAGLKK